MAQTIGGWDVHTHIVPPAVVAAGESRRVRHAGVVRTR